MSSLRINISRLSEGHHHYSLSAEASDVGLDERFMKPVSVEADLEKSNRQMLLQAEARTSGQFVCDRCLDQFSLEVSSRHTVVYIQGSPSPGDRDGSEEVQYLPPDANMIDLGEDVRQFLILSLPLKLLCREDCAGLCPVCGANRNKVTCSCSTNDQDPRWADLKRFLEN